MGTKVKVTVPEEQSRDFKQGDLVVSERSTSIVIVCEPKKDTFTGTILRSGLSGEACGIYREHFQTAHFQLFRGKIELETT